MNVLTTSNGKKVIIVYYDIVIDGDFYFYEDLIDLVKNKELATDDYDMIMSAFSGMPPSNEIINKYACGEDADIRFILAHLGFAPDILVLDPDHAVRAEVANNGDGLERLINDPHPVVRSMVAGNGYGLDILIDDPSHVVREVVAEQGSGLDKLVNDPSPYVRAAVAEQGYCLDILINDEDFYVREIAKKAMSEQNHSHSIL
jgi:hypothetical protein